MDSIAGLKDAWRVASSPRMQVVPYPRQRPVNAGAAAEISAPFTVPGSWGYRVSKRCIDVLGALVGLVLLLPLLPAIVALIKLDSRGSILFRQKRVGRNGHLFTCYKFRSMVPNAESLKTTLAAQNEATGAAFKIRNDPRITAIGHFLRQSSLDEVPQLFNVLRGDMSIVGPRPQIPTEVELYEPWQRRRLAVKPGITCLWQISGRSQVGFEEWMRLDAEYVERRSLRLDLKILLGTLPAVIARKGAY